MTTGLGLDSTSTDGAAPRGTPHHRTARAVVVAGVLLLGLLAVLGLLLARDRAASADVSEAEARAFLGRLVDAGLSRDFDRLCAANGSRFNCRMSLDNGASGTVPAEPPSSVSARFIRTGSDVDLPGWLLTVEGRNGLGLPYKTEVMVFREDDTGDLKAVNAVWWSGDRIAFGDPNGPQTPDAP